MSWAAAAADSAWLRGVSQDLGDLRDHRQMAELAAAAIAERVDSAVSTYNELTARGPAVHLTGPPPAWVVEELVNDLRARLTEHPLASPLLKGSAHDPGVPTRISDMLSTRAWREAPLYQEVLAPRCIPLHSLCLPVGSDGAGRLQFYQFTRDKDFADSEVELVTRLQPVLIALGRRNTRSAESVAAIRLTPCEIEVIRHIALGQTVAGAARRMKVAPATIRKHLEHVHTKLGTSGPVATVRRAIELKLIHPF